MKIIWNNKKFLSSDGKISPYGSICVIINYYYMYGSKLGQGIVAVIRTPCTCNSCQTHMSITWDPKIKYS